jgi:hypothetical protein
MPLSSEEVLVLRVNLALRLKGLSLNALAKELKVNQANMYRAVRSSRNSPQVWKAIVRKCGFDPREAASSELKELCRAVAFEQAA